MFELRNPEIEQLQRDIGKQLKSMMPEGWTFALFMFQNDNAGTFYISSADREGVLLAIKQWVEIQEKDPKFTTFLTAVQRACSFVESHVGETEDTAVIRSYLLAE